MVSAALAVGALVTSTPSQASPADFQQCLAQHGVTVQLPPPPKKAPKGLPPAPPGVDQATWEQAFTACKALAPVPPQR